MKNPYNKAAGGLEAISETIKFTGAESGIFRGTKALLYANQVNGFDCPGCAWPEPHKRSSAEFCENGAKAIADAASLKKVDPAFFAKWSVDDLANQSDQWLNAQGRITHPMVKFENDTHYQSIKWDDVFVLIAENLNKLASPDEAIFYTSGRTSNEAAYLYQLFARMFGTNNLPDCSNMCHESSGVALNETIGVGKGTVGLDDFDEADAIIIIGQNPGTNHPRMLTTLQKAVQRGCKIISINPLREPGLVRFNHPQQVLSLLRAGTEISTLYLQIRINGDMALLQGISKILINEDGVDHDFVSKHTFGYENFVRHVKSVSWDTIVEASGIPKSQIREAAEIINASKRMICCWAMGLTQHKNSVATIQEIVNLLLLTGQLGKPGAGACPVRGHSNVQGDRTMGITEKPHTQFLKRLEKKFKFSAPTKDGFDTVNAIKAMHDTRASVFFGLGGNFLSATPDTQFTARALRNCKLTAHVSTRLNRAHLVTGKIALILPCLSRVEIDEQKTGPQFVTVEDSMSVVHKSEGRLKRSSPDALSEPEIVTRMASATLGDKYPLVWNEFVDDYDRIRDSIANTIEGFVDFNSRVREPGGFVLRNSAAHLEFNTNSGKAKFSISEIFIPELREDEFIMMTIRSHDQFNTTIYTENDRYRGISGNRRVVLMNPEDINRLSFSDGLVVDIHSVFKGETRIASNFVVKEYDIPSRCVATYFPEANILVPIGSVAEKSNTPTSKSVKVSVHYAK